MDGSFWWFAAAGFLAQLVDGALGMAYGITATSLLLSSGVPPAAASAAVHAAEVVTSAASGASHIFAGNVLWPVVRKLAIAGCLGGVAGALILVSDIGAYFQPVVSAYLALMGCLLVLKAFRKPELPKSLRGLEPLGFAGGFLDAIGGGGWGPIVSGTLVLSGNEPRFMIGSSATAEFFVTVAVTIAFAGSLSGAEFGWIGFALVLGGLPAAPLAAVLVRVAPRSALMAIVGALVVVLGVWGLGRFFLG